MPPSSELDSLSVVQLKDLVVALLSEVAALKQTVLAQREEIARLKGLKGPLVIKPSGMEQATLPGPKSAPGKPHRGKVRPRVSIEDRVLSIAAPAGSRFKGYVPYVVQDVVLSARAIRYRRERWVTPDGQTITAPLPAGIVGHYGAELRRFVLMLYHQGQSTLSRVAALLRSIGVAISERQAQRLLTEGHDVFLMESRDVLRAGLRSASWISVDDTGARHRVANAFCTQIGNDRFTWFGTRATKSRLNILDLLRGGYGDFAVNQAALAYMRAHEMPLPLIARLGESSERYFADAPAWQAHLARLAIAPPADPAKPRRKGAFVRDNARLATEAALWGSVQAHGFLCEGVLLSEDAQQFDFGRHALCWVHAERLIHKLDTFTEAQRDAQARVRGLVWGFYADLKVYRAAPQKQHAQELRERFDAIFHLETGFTALDRLLRRLRDKKTQLLMVLDQPEVPLHTNGSENDIRCHVTRRKISAGTRSDSGRDCRDAFLGLAKTCAKLGVNFWTYLGDRLRVPDNQQVQPLAQLLLATAAAS
jgi:Transposase IS66 family